MILDHAIAWYTLVSDKKVGESFFGGGWEKKKVQREAYI